MNFKGKFEAITEATLGRFQQGGIMVGDIVKIKPKALNHPKIKEMGDNVIGNIKMFMDTDLNIAVTALKSTRPSQGDMGDGLGNGSTTAPTDFWVDIAVLHSPALKSDPITVPIEILERQDFGANLPPVPDSLKRKGNVNIKPIDASEYVVRMESIEDIYSTMGGDKQAVTVRVPMEDSEEARDVLDQQGVTYSVIGKGRFELHGEMDNIQNAMNTISSQGQGGVVDVEFVGAESDPADPASQHIPTDDGMPSKSLDLPAPSIETDDDKSGTDDDNLEEAYNGIMTGKVKTNEFIIEVPNAFADNVRNYLASEGVNNSVNVDGNKSYITIASTSSKDAIGVALKDNVMGDLTFLRVHQSKQQMG